MPNKIKYTTNPTANTIKVGNFVLGVVTGVTYAPTSTTSFYNGYNVPSGGYVVYQNKATLGPSVFAPTGDAQMVNLTKSLGNATATTIYDSLKWINAQNTIIAVNREYENIVTSGLTMSLDAGFTPSYPLSGTSWTDLSFSGNNGTLVNTPTYSSSNGGTIVFDGTNDYVNGPAISSQLTGNITVEAWVYITSGPSDWVRIIGTGSNPSGNRTFGLWYDINRRLLWQRYGATDPSIYPANVLSYNTWYYVAATTSSNSHALYLNGSSIGSSTAAGPWPASNENVTIGSAVGIHAFLTGNISIARIYNRGLSSTEILQNYDAQKGRYVSTPTPTPTSSPTVTPTISPTVTPTRTLTPTPTRTLTPTPTISSAPSIDPDAQAFITAAGITDPTQQSAINTLVVGLKVDGIWTKMMAIYPFVGGTASSHKYNLKDPRDLNVAYRITFYGGWSHGSYGIAGNSTNTYADTNIVNYNLGQMGAYATAGDYMIYGGRYALDYQYDTLYYFPNISNFSESAYQVAYFSNSTDGSNIMFTFNGYIGLSTISGGDGTSKQYFNGSLIANVSPVTNPSPLPVSLWFGAIQTGYNLQNPTYDFYSDGTFAFGFVASSILNSTENTNLYSRVQAYQITLGRDV